MTRSHTPRIDALVDRLSAAMEETGLKTEVARIIEREAGITFQAAKNRLSRILGRTVLPNGEDTLLLVEWLESRPPAPSARRTARKR